MPLQDVTNDLTHDLTLTPSPPLCRQPSEWRDSRPGSGVQAEQSVAELLAASRRDLMQAIEACTVSPYCSSDEGDGEDGCVGCDADNGVDGCAGGEERYCKLCQPSSDGATAAVAEASAGEDTTALRNELVATHRELAQLRAKHEVLAGENRALQADLDTTVEYLEGARPILEPYFCSGQLPSPTSMTAAGVGGAMAAAVAASAASRQGAARRVVPHAPDQSPVVCNRRSRGALVDSGSLGVGTLFASSEASEGSSP